MGMYLVTGQPGHGKTAFALVKAFKFKEQGRAVYAHGVKDLDYAKAGFTYLEDPTKWQDLPDGSVILLDECYNVFPNRNPGAKVPEHVEAMARHRHRGFDFIMVAQQGLQLDPFLRGLYEEHVHVRQTSIWKAKSKLKRWTQYQGNVNAVCADIEDWLRPKWVFEYYTSTTQITTQRRIPMWLRWIAVLLVVLLGTMYYLKHRVTERVAALDATPSAHSAAATDRGGNAAGGRGGAESRTYETPTDYAIAHRPRFDTMPWTAPVYDGGTPARQPELYCMSSLPADGDAREASCTCITEQGTKYEISQPQCRRVARFGPPYNPYKQPMMPQVAQVETPAPDKAPAGAPVAMALPGNITHVGEPQNIVKAPEPHF